VGVVACVTGLLIQKLYGATGRSMRGDPSPCSPACPRAGPAQLRGGGGGAWRRSTAVVVGGGGGGADLGGWAVGVVGGGDNSGHRRSSRGGGGGAASAAGGGWGRKGSRRWRRMRRRRAIPIQSQRGRTHGGRRRGSRTCQARDSLRRRVALIDSKLVAWLAGRSGGRLLMRRWT
jgi:hypothetical protein